MYLIYVPQTSARLMMADTLFGISLLKIKNQYY